ncbi:hypothetical protein MNBD_GAMMA12-1383 [hydrothermal vent metagenome]|uniref:HPt domain-containing protein n=1 Tax=hydrothermal vent metagenome TaxID=652676 RepID=A0A3B0YMY6_9ZZZZ
MSQDVSATVESLNNHLNAQAITELQELLGTDKFKYLVNIFCENSNKTIEILKENSTDHDFEVLYASGHSLAGSSANMGALVLCELCRQLEQQAKSKFAEHIPTLIEGIIAEHKQVLAEFAKLIS